MPSVLFVCTGNQFRSPIAAETFRRQIQRDGVEARWTVKSAGTWTTPGQPAMRLAVEAARSLGIDLSSHSTRLVDSDLLKGSDMVLVMEAGHKESLLVEFPFVRGRVHLIAEALEGIAYDIPDPVRSPGETQEILRDLVDMVRKGSAKIYKMAEAG